MNRTKTALHISLCILLLIMASLPFVNIGFSQSEKLRGKISIQLAIEKKQLLEGENIYYELTIRNLVNREMRTPKLSSGAFRIRVTDAQGKELSRAVILDGLEGGLADYMVLKAEEVIVKTVGHNVTTGETARIAAGGLIAAGTYRSQAILADVKSNLVEFHVVKPTGKDWEVAQKIDQLNKFASWEQALEDAKSLVIQYPNTVYLPNIYTRLFIRLRASSDMRHRTDELMERAMECMRKLPNSGFATTALRFYVEGLSNKLGIETGAKPSPTQQQLIDDKLRELRETFTDTKVARYIDEKINNK